VLEQYAVNVDLLLCRHTTALNWGNAFFIRKCWIMYSCILFWALYSCILFWAYPCFGPWRSNTLPKLFFLLISGINKMWGWRFVQNQTQEGNSYLCTSFRDFLTNFYFSNKLISMATEYIYVCYLQRVVVACNYVRILRFFFIISSWNS
jgi:hypothetical protein